MKILLALVAAAGLLAAADLKLGKPLTLKEPVALAAVLAAPGDYVGKTVQVEGKIVEVCQMMGCWLDLTNLDGQKIRVKVEDGEIVFPKDAAGKTVIAEGRFAVDTVKDGKTTYQIQGTGAVIRGN